MAEAMVKIASKWKTDTILKNQLFEIYNIVLQVKDDSDTLNALKMHLVFGSGISAPAWNVADACVCSVSRRSWNAQTKDKVHI